MNNYLVAMSDGKKFRVSDASAAFLHKRMQTEQGFAVIQTETGEVSINLNHVVYILSPEVVR